MGLFLYCRRMANLVTCYLKSVNNVHDGIFLPHDCPVIVGRMPELKISDKSCSRNQLELKANCIKRHVLAKCLGPNPSQIEGINIDKRISSKLKPGQTLYIANMKYPHCVVFENADEGHKENPIRDVSDQASNISSVSSSSFDRKRTLDTSPNKKKLKKRNLLRDEVSKSCETELNNDSEYTYKTPGVKSRTISHISLSKSDNSEVTPLKSIPKTNHWSQGLKSAMSDPEMIVYQDNLVVVIKDKYPKAKFHWLVLPVADISSLGRLDTSHVDLLKHMLKKGEETAEEAKLDAALRFRFGYHAVASMSQLHMHVISQDFSSSCLKTKKHWNSFTSDYFVDSQVIIDELNKNGKVTNRKSYTNHLNKPLQCHICCKAQKNMPTLKKHIETCIKA